MSKIIRKILSIPFIVLFVFLLATNVQAAAITINNFNLSPNVVTTTSGGTTQFQMTLRLTMDVAQFNAACGSNTNEFAWYVYAGAGMKKASGMQSFNRTATSLSLNLDKSIVVDVSAPEFRGGTFDYYASIYCPGTFGDKLTESARVKITFGTSSTTDKVWACVAADNKYACSPGNLTNLSDVPSCSGRTPVQVGNNLCGQDSGTGGGGGGGTGCGTPGQPACAPGTTQEYSFEITNPLKGGATDFTSLVKIIAQWIFNLAIPIAVAMIVYAGILFLTSSGEPGKITKAKQVLTYAVIGLAIILIGSGFVTLIQSILELGGTGQTQQTLTPIPTSTTTPISSLGAIGNYCGSKDSNCFTGLKCKNTICQRPTGNLIGEACVGGTNCAATLACDLTSRAQQIIDGQTLGSCYQP